MKNICLSLCGLLICAVLFVKPIHAQSKNTVKLSPAYVDVVLKDPQEETPVSFFLENNGSKPLSFELFSIDFQQKDDLGTIGFLGKSASNYSYSLSSFLTFKNPNIVVSPGEREEIEVIIQNREDLTPGSHYAAIVAREVQEESDKPSVAPAISGLIYVTKQGGERYNLSFKDFSFPSRVVSFSNPATAFVTLQNDGNTYLIPYGTADIFDSFGRRIFKGIINEPSVRVFPQSVRRVPVYFRDTAFEFPISINTIKLQGRDSLNKTKFSYQEVYVYINPWFVGSIVLITFLIVGYRKVLVKKRRKPSHD